MCITRYNPRPARSLASGYEKTEHVFDIVNILVWTIKNGILLSYLS